MNRSTVIIIVIIALIVGYASIFTVQEGQSGLLTRLGKLERNANGEVKIYTPGLHFKVPFINQVLIFDTRLQTLDIESSRIVTEEKKDVLVDYYVKWRIIDLSRYYTRTQGNPFQAETLLRQQINDGLRAQFGKRNISEVVSGERTDIMETVQLQAQSTAQNLGIDVIDVRIKRIDLPVEVSNAVFERMRTERQRIANGHRADGKSKAEQIRAQADARSAIIVAEARSEGQKIRGKGDARAAEIYANAYGQNRDFFNFYRSMDAYRSIFNTSQDFLVLQPDGDFFKYFNRADAQVAE
ncbi:MAG: protease modulator HflC [Legionellales bacterium]|nr:protease modulator HflC [Legionellales bacterium]